MKITNRFGCPEFTRAHDLRHLFASRAQEAGMNPLLVEDMLGHSTMDMTRRYTHFRLGRHAGCSGEAQLRKGKWAEGNLTRSAVPRWKQAEAQVPAIIRKQTSVSSRCFSTSILASSRLGIDVEFFPFRAQDLVGRACDPRASLLATESHHSCPGRARPRRSKCERGEGLLRASVQDHDRRSLGWTACRFSFAVRSR
jgi:hypothetical protein